MKVPLREIVKLFNLFFKPELIELVRQSSHIQLFQQEGNFFIVFRHDGEAEEGRREIADKIIQLVKKALPETIIHQDENLGSVATVEIRKEEVEKYVK